MPRIALALLLLSCAGLGACRSTPPPTFEAFAADGSEPLGTAPRVPPRHGDEILVGGRIVRTGAPVVLWGDGAGYSAYRTQPHFGEPVPGGPEGLRYRAGREGQAPEDAIDKLVLHYDACGVSRECFRVLHDQRGLSVHFLLDIDGTIYQTLDVSETAWHARQANGSSIGVEIAQVGAYAPSDTQAIKRWYTLDERGVRIDVPRRLGDGGVRTRGFIGRPARPNLIEGRVHGRVWSQYDFTPQQYESLAKLTAALARALPKLRLDIPRDKRGKPLMRALSDAEFEEFSGILGHFHVSADKRDPGPAFDWERYLGRIRLNAVP